MTLSFMSHVSCHMRHVCVSFHVCQIETGGADFKCVCAFFLCVGGAMAFWAVSRTCALFECLLCCPLSLFCLLCCPLWCLLCCLLSLFQADMSLKNKWCTYPYTHTHTHTCAHAHTHTHTQEHTHTNAHTHTLTHMSVCVCG